MLVQKSVKYRRLVEGSDLEVYLLFEHNGLTVLALDLPFSDLACLGEK